MRSAAWVFIVDFLVKCDRAFFLTNREGAKDTKQDKRREEKEFTIDWVIHRQTYRKVVRIDPKSHHIELSAVLSLEREFLDLKVA